MKRFLLLLPLPLLSICFFLLAFLSQSCVVQRVDRTPYEQTVYYKKTKEAVAQISLNTGQQDTVRVGWAKVNITPNDQVPMAGYGKRRGKQFTAVHDSIWVRAFVFENGTAKAALVTMDLLIVPMTVTEALSKQLPALGYDLSNTYLSATHTHSSIGGWGRRLAGKLIVGKYDKKVVKKLTEAILQAICIAEKKTAIAKIGYAEMNASKYVYNRLVGSAGTRDTLLRVLQIKKQTGERALLSTFSAHATCLGADVLELSCDYPGAMVRALEQDGRVDFAAFAAGAVGSHGPRAEKEGFEKVQQLGQGLASLVEARLDSIPLRYQFRLHSVAVPLGLRSPHWRISQEWRVRPWLFYALFGKYPSQLTALGIGEHVLVGMPCDFSGELLPTLQQHAASQGKQLLLTSFNGGYIGYITPDKYYDLKKYETRDMNLFGPGNGAYFSELIRDLVDKLAY